MGKFNKKTRNAMFNEEDTTVDWSQLISDFENSSVEKAIENIMIKINKNENIEFDQACLVLKHYLLLNDNKSYLNHFLTFNQSVYFNELIQRFNTSNSTPNVTWMISELIKVLTSVCDLEQANYMLNSDMFRTLLCSTIFDTSLLNKLNHKSNATNRTSLIESATLTNMFETVSNLCDINNNLIHFLTPTHIEWMHQALIITDSNSNKSLIVSIARLFHLFTELLFKTSENSSDKIEMILDLFLNKKFIQNIFNNLTLPIVDSNNNTVCNNQVSKLYLIGTFITVVLYSKNQSINLNRSDLISNLMQEYGSLFDCVLNNKINNLNDQFKHLEQQSNEEPDESEYKALLKSTEVLIECKLLAIDIIKQILTHFSKEDETNSDDEDLEEVVESDDENCNEMETEQQSDMIDSSLEIKNENLILNTNNLFSSLLNTLLNDDENFMQNTNKIEHIFNSVNLIKLEASQACLLMIQFIQTNSLVTNISIVHLNEILKSLLKQSIDESDLVVGKLAELCSNVFIYLNNNHNFETNTKLELVSLIKDVLFKYKIDDYDLCIELSRILTLVSIKERNSMNANSAMIIDTSARILIDLISASFELNDQMSIKSLKLNAELIDFLIDLFSEDNLKEIELNLNFIEKIQLFSEKFYFKYKTLASKKKLKKDDGLIVRTVKDNLKPFVEYKIQKLK